MPLLFLEARGLPLVAFEVSWATVASELSRRRGLVSVARALVDGVVVCFL